MEDGKFFLEMSTLEYTISEPRAKADGTKTKPSPRYKKIKMLLYIPEKRSKKTGKVNGFEYKGEFLKCLAKGEPYQVEILLNNGEVDVHITFELEKQPMVSTGHNFMMGIDTNPDGLALTLINRQGNYIWHTYLREPKLLLASGDKRDNLCGNLAKEAVILAKYFGAAIALENLKFSDDRDVKAKLARTIHQFCYAKLLKGIEACCYKEGVELVKVRPQYTSTIGLLKYCHQYGLCVHNGSALVIARRAYGFKERVPKLYRSFFKPIPVIEKEELVYKEYKYSNEWANWSNVRSKIKLILRNDMNPQFFIENRNNIKDMVLV